MRLVQTRGAEDGAWSLSDGPHVLHTHVGAVAVVATVPSTAVLLKCWSLAFF